MMDFNTAAVRSSYSKIRKTLGNPEDSRAIRERWQH